MSQPTTLAAASLGPARLMRTYDPSSVDVDLIDEGGDQCRWVTVFASGTLVVVGSDGEEVTLPAAPNGHTFIGYFKELKSTSTCTSVVVGW